MSVVFRRADVPVARRTTERARRIAEATMLPAWAAAACVGALSAATRVGSIGFLSGLGLLVGLAAMFLGRRRDAASLEARSGSLELDERALVITSGAETESVARADLDAGWIDAADATVLRLRSGKEIVLSLGREEGRELLGHLGLTARDRAARIPYAGAIPQLTARLRAIFGVRVELGIASLSVWLPILSCLFALGSGVAWWEVQHAESPPRALVGGALALLGPLMGLVAMARSQRRRWVTVGTDGISIRRALRRPLFVPWTRVERAVREECGVRLVLKDGSHIDLDRTHGGDVLHDRIQEAMAVRLPSDGAAAELEQLDRRGRPVAEWRDDLKRIATQSEGYREGQLDVDTIASTIGDPGLPLDRRVGAAMMLSGMGEPERDRVRIAVDQLADDATRAKLERAAEGEIAEAALEQPAPRRRHSDETP